MKRLLQPFFFCLALLTASTSGAQDIHFSQFYETPLFRNPALAGINNADVRVQTVYRTQWTSVANAYKTASANAEYKMPVGNGDNFATLGLQMFYDRAGTTDLTSTQVLPALNFHKSVSAERNTYVSVGFMGGLVQRRIDRSKMTTNSQYEGYGDGESAINAAYQYFDGSVGISLNSDFGANPANSFILGIAYHHINRPNSSFFADGNIEMAPKYVYTGALKLGVTETSDMTFHLDHTRQGAYVETIGGLLYSLKLGDDYENPLYTLSGGAFLRWKDAFIPTIKLDYRPFSVGLSYDVNVSPLKSSSGGRGGFELSLTYNGFLNRDNSSLNAVHCPRF